MRKATSSLISLNFGLKNLFSTKQTALNESITCAAIDYRFGCVTHGTDFFKKIEALLEKARQKKIELLLLPEYAGQEWSWTLADNEPAIFKRLPNALNDYLEQMAKLAKKYSITFIPGTIPTHNPCTGKFTNRSHIFSPKGDIIGWQDKITLTQSEINDGWYEEGDTLNIFSMDWGSFVILICYDLEFPGLATRLIGHQVDYILAPTYTPSKAGFNRVLISARARAHENQCFVIHSTSKGRLGMLEEYAIGKPGIYGPIIEGMSSSGRFEIVEDQICYYTCESTVLENLRKHGEVRTLYDQYRLEKRSIKVNKVDSLFCKKTSVSI